MSLVPIFTEDLRCLNFMPVTFVGHPDTEPEAIRAAQREAVREAVVRVGDDPALVSAEAVLPVSVVLARLDEIEGRQPALARKARQPRNSIGPTILRALAEGPRTVGQIAEATGLNPAVVSDYVRKRPRVFWRRQLQTPGVGGRPPLLVTLRRAA